MISTVDIYANNMKVMATDELPMALCRLMHCGDKKSFGFGGTVSKCQIDPIYDTSLDTIRESRS